MKYKKLLFLKLILLSFFIGFTLPALGQPDLPPPADSGVNFPAPPTEVSVKDYPDDNGHALSISWKLSSDDGAGKKNVVMYEILRADTSTGPFVSRGLVPLGTNSYQDKGDKEKESPNYLPMYKNYWYKVKARSESGYSESKVSSPGFAKPQYFHLGKLPVFVASVVFLILVIVFLNLARKGKELFVRPLAGIDAVDEAIGRATEMGRPILYVLGIGTAGDLATIASFTILARVAKKTAEYQTKILVPCCDPIVMSVAQETVKAAYLDAGRPEAYKEENIFYITSMQFAYVAAVNGIMLREKTATNFYLGYFAAESLLLAETGSIAGSIQISGTDQIAQIPFFIAATDYTLIGEELYAASAYLGREPLLLGALKAQDWFKAIAIVSIIIGVFAASFHWDFFVQFFNVRI